jgi:hypothetical protein
MEHNAPELFLGKRRALDDKSTLEYLHDMANAVGRISFSIEVDDIDTIYIDTVHDKPPYGFVSTWL